MAKISHDDIDKFFEYGIDIPNRTIYMGSTAYDYEGSGNGTDFFMAEKLIKSLHILENDSVHGNKSITIISNNPGGDWYEGMAMFGAIESCKSHVVMKLYGYAMSMGSIIPQAADEILIDKRCTFMIHYGSNGGYGHSKLFEKWGDQEKFLSAQMEDIYLDKMEDKIKNVGEDVMSKSVNKILDRQSSLKIKPKKHNFKFSKKKETARRQLRDALEELLNFDSFLTAQETIELGFADGLIED